MGRERRVWTPEEDEKLTSLAGTLSTKQIAKELGRSESAVRIRGYKIGSKLDGMHRRSIRGQISKNVLLLYKTHSINEISRITGLTYSQIYWITTQKAI